MISKSADPAGDGRQKRVIRFCGQFRYANYLEQEDDDPARAIRLAHWNTMAAGVMHEQLGYVEIAVRNAIDRELCDWNMRNNGSPDWTDPSRLPYPIDKLIAKQIKDAWSKLKNPSHGAVVDRLMWGTWVKLVGSADPMPKPDTKRDSGRRPCTRPSPPPLMPGMGTVNRTAGISPECSNTCASTATSKRISWIFGTCPRRRRGSYKPPSNCCLRSTPPVSMAGSPPPPSGGS